jgi:hypothetical protein
MPIAFDAASVGKNDFTTTVTVAHTCTGSNLALFVGLIGFNSVTGVTYNGVAMTLVRTEGASDPPSRIYVLANPATGTNNIVATASANATGHLHGASFTGVDQSTPSDADGGGSNAFQNSPRSDNITVSAGGYAFSAVGKNVSGAFTPDSGQTEVGAQQTSSQGISACGYLSAATAISWSWSDGQQHCEHVIAAIKAAAAGGGEGPALRVNTTGMRW